MKTAVESRWSRVERLRPKYERGLTLIDCIAYMALLALIFELTFAAFYRTTENSQSLARNAADIARALHAGEAWREDVRRATQPPQLEPADGNPVLRLPQSAGEVSYTFMEDAVYRRVLPNTNWVLFLPAVTSSTMYHESRQQVSSWHWDVELKGRQKVARVRPVFSFAAVPKKTPAP